MARKPKHGMCYTKIYGVYKQARYRCTQPTNKQYHNYGGRGIKFLRNSFEEFYKDMGESYYKHIQIFGENNTSLDRIDNNGNYCKENCRWATQKEQCNNKRTCVNFEFNGIKYCSIKEFVEKNKGYNHSTLSHRIVKGMSAEEAITKPISKEIKYKGKTYKSLATLCRKLGKPYSSVCTRINNLGWPIEKAIDAPIDEKFRHKNN